MLVYTWNMGNELLKDITFCVIDIETTGGNKLTDDIIEIGLVKIHNKVIVSQLGFLIQTKIPIPPYVQKLTQISPQKLQECPYIDEVLDDIIHFIGTSIIVAHNASFDVPFLNAIIVRNNRSPLLNNYICTNVLTNNIIPGLLHSNLNYLAQLFNIPHDNAHRALVDAKACAELFIHYLHFFSLRKIHKINHIYYPKGKFEYDTLHFSNENFDLTLEQIKSTKEALNIVIKGPQGKIIAFIPLLRPMDHYHFVQKCLENTNWEIITIKLMGPFIHGLLELDSYITKMEPQLSKKVIHFIKNQYFPISLPSSINVISKFDQLFIVAPHKMKNQFILYSINNLPYYKHFVFKLPLHETRLGQFINSCSKQIALKKGAKRRMHDQVWIFLDELIKNHEHFGHLLFDLNEFKEKRQKLFQRITEFATNFTFTTNYPSVPL